MLSAPLASHEYAGFVGAREFLERTRAELRMLRKVRVYRDRLHVVDVNKDYFEVRGVGYPDADIVLLLQDLNTAFNPKSIHEPITGDYKEFDTGRRYCWAQDRVM